MTDEATIVLDPASGRTGTPEDFVDLFRRVWSDPVAHVGPFFDVLSPDVRLVDPVSVTEGRLESEAYMHGLLAMIPTIRGEVDSWAFRSDDDGTAELFIAMRFLVDRDGRTDEIRNVDIFAFDDGVAVSRTAHLDPAALLGG